MSPDITRRVLACLSFVGAAACLPSTASAQAGFEQPARGAPIFESAGCPPIHVPAGRRLDCGYLRVPERRSNPRSRRIRIAVAILRTPAPDKAQDPIVYLRGGPGYGAIEVAQLPEIPAYIREVRRDVVLFDQRGTGFSEPNLSCETESAGVGGRTLAANPEAERQHHLDVLRRCRHRLQASGVDLAGYDTAEIAADVRDLRIALGYSSWNLVGNSYGSAIALATARLYPEGIRSVVIASIQPSLAYTYATRGAAVNGSFRRLFDGCRADEACAEAFPDLEERFYRFVAERDQHPIALDIPDAPGGHVRRVWLNGGFIANGVVRAMTDSTLLPWVPLLLSEIANGNRAVLEAVVEQMAGQGTFSRRMSTGTFLSTVCREMPLPPHADWPGRGESVDLRLGSILDTEDTADSCRVWDVGTAETSMREIGPIAAPVLMFSGEYDSITPLANAKFVSRALPQGQLVVVPSGTHDFPRYECARTIREAFLDMPNRAPDISCLEAFRSFHFATRVWRTPIAPTLAGALRRDRSDVVWPLGALVLLVVLPVRWLAVRGVAASVDRRMRFCLAALIGVDVALAAAIGAALLYTAAGTDQPMLLAGFPLRSRLPIVLLACVAAAFTIWTFALAVVGRRSLRLAGTWMDVVVVLAGSSAFLGWLGAVHFS
jgi:pimeloyl-ACP methyl ester carboxylesterase